MSEILYNFITPELKELVYKHAQGTATPVEILEFNTKEAELYDNVQAHYAKLSSFMAKLEDILEVTKKIKEAQENVKVFRDFEQKGLIDTSSTLTFDERFYNDLTHLGRDYYHAYDFNQIGELKQQIQELQSKITVLKSLIDEHNSHPDTTHPIDSGTDDKIPVEKVLE